jgi:hypothetical protein
MLTLEAQLFFGRITGNTEVSGNRTPKSRIFGNVGFRPAEVGHNAVSRNQEIPDPQAAECVHLPRWSL